MTTQHPIPEHLQDLAHDLHRQIADDQGRVRPLKENYTGSGLR